MHADVAAEDSLRLSQLDCDVLEQLPSPLRREVEDRARKCSAAAAADGRSPPTGAACDRGAAVEGLAAGQAWLCGACTFENDARCARCEMCDAPHPLPPLGPQSAGAAGGATAAVGGARGQKRGGGGGGGGGGGIAKKLQMTLGSFGTGKQLPPEYDPKVLPALAAARCTLGLARLRRIWPCACPNEAGRDPRAGAAGAAARDPAAGRRGPAS